MTYRPFTLCFRQTEGGDVRTLPSSTINHWRCQILLKRGEEEKEKKPKKILGNRYRLSNEQCYIVSQVPEVAKKGRMGVMRDGTKRSQSMVLPLPSIVRKFAMTDYSDRFLQSVTYFSAFNTVLHPLNLLPFLFFLNHDHFRRREDLGI